jgi:hypothetical protein
MLLRDVLWTCIRLRLTSAYASVIRMPYLAHEACAAVNSALHHYFLLANLKLKECALVIQVAPRARPHHKLTHTIRSFSRSSALQRLCN